MKFYYEDKDISKSECKLLFLRPGDYFLKDRKPYVVVFKNEINGLAVVHEICTDKMVLMNISTYVNRFLRKNEIPFYELKTGDVFRFFHKRKDIFCRVKQKDIDGLYYYLNLRTDEHELYMYDENLYVEIIPDKICKLFCSLSDGDYFYYQNKRYKKIKPTSILYTDGPCVNSMGIYDVPVYRHFKDFTYVMCDK